MTAHREGRQIRLFRDYCLDGWNNDTSWPADRKKICFKKGGEIAIMPEMGGFSKNSTEKPGIWKSQGAATSLHTEGIIRNNYEP